MYMCWVGLVLYEINRVDCGVKRGVMGYYIYGRDSVNVFYMGDGGIKRVIKGVIILYL